MKLVYQVLVLSEILHFRPFTMRALPDPNHFQIIKEALRINTDLLKQGHKAIKIITKDALGKESFIILRAPPPPTIPTTQVKKEELPQLQQGISNFTGKRGRPRILRPAPASVTPDQSVTGQRKAAGGADVVSEPQSSVAGLNTSPSTRQKIFTGRRGRPRVEKIKDSTKCISQSASRRVSKALPSLAMKSVIKEDEMAAGLVCNDCGLSFKTRQELQDHVKKEANLLLDKAIQKYMKQTEEPRPKVYANKSGRPKTGTWQLKKTATKTKKETKDEGNKMNDHKSSLVSPTGTPYREKIEEVKDAEHIKIRPKRTYGGTKIIKERKINKAGIPNGTPQESQMYMPSKIHLELTREGLFEGLDLAESLMLLAEQRLVK